MGVVVSDNEFVEMLKTISNGMVQHENRHLFIMEFVNSLDKYVLPNRRPIIKRFLMTVLKQFSSSPLRSVHFETFSLWLLLEKYSETMDIKKILDHVNHLYEDYLPYYRVYISELLSKNEMDEAMKMLETCKLKCKLTDEQCAEEFPTLNKSATPRKASTGSYTLGKTLISFSEEVDDDEEMICTQTETLSLDTNVTVKKLADLYKEKSGFLSVLVATLVGAQLAELLSHTQPEKLGPQSVVISEPLDELSSPEKLVDSCILKVVELKKPSGNTEDKNVASGFLNVIGYLLFLDTFDVIETDSGHAPNKIISRRYPDRETWQKIFHRLLNNNSNKTDWAALASELKQNFIQLASANTSFWIASVGEFNNHFRDLSI